MFLVDLDGIATDYLWKMKWKRPKSFPEHPLLKLLELQLSMKNAAPLFCVIQKNGSKLSREWDAGSLSIKHIGRWISTSWNRFGGFLDSYIKKGWFMRDL